MINALRFFLFITLFPYSLVAQFGPKNYVFKSEASYPSVLFSGDIDMDGDIDVVMQSHLYVGLHENLGSGVFAKSRTIIGSIEFNAGDRTCVADIDNDGDGDLVKNSHWYQNNGPTSSFTSMGLFVPAGVSSGGLLKDLDSDGDVDDIGYAAANVFTLINDGTGIFSIGDTIGISGPSSTVNVSYAYVNTDSIKDLVIGGNNSQGGLYFGLGNGLFGTIDSIENFTSPAVPVLGDMDADGDIDLIAFGASPGARWWRNNGSGFFELADTISLSVEIPQVVADIDGDNDLDYSIATGTTCDVVVNRNDSGEVWTILKIEDYGYNLIGTSYDSGDLDNDGDEDLFICNGLSIAAWYPNLGNGNIGPRQRLAKFISYTQDLTYGDFDIDGDLDFAAVDYYGRSIALFIRNGSVYEQEILFEGVTASFIRACDLNSDNRPDLITNNPLFAIIWNTPAGWIPDTLPGSIVAKQALDADEDGDNDLICSGQWLRNDGGFFSQVTAPDFPILVGGIDTADLNNDGHLDILSGYSDTICVLLNDGLGNFTKILSHGYTSEVDLADMDSDGDIDLASLTSGATLCVYFNDGVGNFNGGVQHSFFSNSECILVWDIDNDADNDVLWSTTYNYNQKVQLNRNLGNGQLGPIELIDPSASIATTMLIADINNDALPDLVTAHALNISWRENYYYKKFRMHGSVFNDYNANATLDSNDQKIPFQLVRSNVNNSIVWTNSDGDFVIGANNGTFSIWTNPPINYQVTNNPDTLQATLSATQPVQTGINFGFAPQTIDSTFILSVTTSNSLTRCNQPNSLWINVINEGSFIPENVPVRIAFHPDITIVSFSTLPDSIDGNNYYWHIDSLGWFEQWKVNIELITGTLNSNSTVVASVLWTDSTMGELSQSAGGLVTCSFDPNDKLVFPEGYGAFGALETNSKFLEYTIRFQNTGNDTAFNVTIRDVLDSAFDWSSLQVIASSHEITGISVDDLGKATFIFENIFLPDSNVNEFASHGFIKYRINLREGLSHETQFKNYASIFFDLNEPVITNTTVNTLVDCDLHNPTVTFNGRDSLFASEGEFFQWYFNGSILPMVNSKTLIIDSIGEYFVSVTSIYGCVSFSDTVFVNCLPQTNFVSENICYGDSFYFAYGLIYSNGIYINTYQDYLGCDSTVSLTLNVSTQAIIIHSGDSLSVDSIGRFSWLDCDNKLIIPGETGNVFHPSTTGNYACIIDQSGCIDTTACILVIVTSNNNNNNNYNLITINPNPVRDVLTLKGVIDYDQKIHIRDISGRIVLEEQPAESEINVGNLQEGMYQLFISTIEGLHVLKFVVRKISSEN